MRPLSWIIFAMISVALLVVPAHAQPVHDPSQWHPPGFGHEHGEAPPDWLVAADQDPTFHQYFGSWLRYEGAFSTSSAENAAKHAGMKGYRITYHPNPALGFSDVYGGWLDGYVVMHGFSNPMDRGAQFHSVRYSIRDSKGTLTMQQGWVNYGDPDTARAPARCPANGSTSGGEDCPAWDVNQRPVILFVDQASWDRGLRNEQWYGFGVRAAWGFGYNTTTIRTPGERSTDTDPNHWHHTGQDGTLRSIDLNICDPGVAGCAVPGIVKGQGFLTDPKGVGYQFGDPRCEAEVQCLLQYYGANFKGVRGRRLDVDNPNPSPLVMPN